MNTLNELYLSQYALSTFDTCPRKFRYRYVDGLFWPRNWTSRDQRERLEKGRLFHLLAQRYFSGATTAIPPGALFREELSKWVARLKELITIDPDSVYLPELHIKLETGGIRLQAKYDLIVLSGNRAQIFDWKTDERPLQQARLARAGQTRVYRYLAVEAANIYARGTTIKPGGMDMTYWNPSYPAGAVSLPYSEAEHREAGRNLHELINHIRSLRYQDFAETSDLKSCPGCEYSPICQGRAATGGDPSDEDFDPGEDLSWEDAPEIVY
jgi:CRISPR/Cas system-associated exonuclease Cas4 (RecB family)